MPRRGKGQGPAGVPFDGTAPYVEAENFPNPPPIGFVSGFTTLDLAILVLYFAGVTVWGVWLGRGQTGARDYFLGGRNLPWPAVLFSVVATETSTLTFLSIPGLAYATDLGFLQLTIGYLLGRIVVAFVLLPAYYRGELGTAYALLETRFGLPTRRFASIIFMITRALASGVRHFATAIPLAIITGWSYPVSILVVGAFLSMASHGADQYIVQRLLTCRSLRQSQTALIGSGVIVIAQFGLFLVIGLALWHFYGGRAFERTDEIFMTFIVEQLPAGLTGLLIAGLLASAMSSLSSALNSLASSSLYDIYQPLFGGGERELFRVGRLFTLLWGLVLVGGAMLFRTKGTPVVELGLAIASFTYGGLLGGFFLGILNRRAVQRDAITAIAVGILVMSFFVLSEWYARALAGLRWQAGADAVTALGSIAWPWHAVIGTTITIAVGSLLALRNPRARDRKAGASSMVGTR